MLPAGASCETNQPETSRKLRQHFPGTRETVAHAGMCVVDLAKLAHLLVQPRRALRERPACLGREINGDSARHDDIQEVTLAEGGFDCTHPLLLEPPELRLPEGEACIVPERAEVAQVILDPLDLEAQRAQELRTRRDGCAAEPLARLTVRPREG